MLVIFIISLMSVIVREYSTCKSLERKTKPRLPFALVKTMHDRN